MTNRTTHIINSALRPFAGASIDAKTYLPVSSFPSGAQIAAWDAAGPPKSSI